MKANNFSEFSRQNPKGIILYFFTILFRIIKSSWVLIPIFITKKNISFDTTIVIGSIALLTLVILVISILYYLNFKFKIKDNHFILTQGIFNKTNTSIAFERIQNINFKQNLLQQIIGVTKVEIETAGAKKTEVSVKALSKERAILLKEAVLKEDYILDQTLENEPKIVPKKVILKITLSQLAKVALTENHFKSLGIAIALYLSLSSQLGDYFKQFKIENMIDGAEIFINENSEVITNSYLIIASIVFFAIIISLIVSTVLVFLFHFDLTLSVKKDSLEINQGLFTKRNNILKKEKVQYITISSNPLKKLLKINSIFFKQASSEKVKKKKQIRVVGSKKPQNNMLKHLLFGEHEYSNLEVYKPDFYYIYQMIIKSIIIITIINTVLYFGFEKPNYISMNLFLLLITSLFIYLRYTKSYFKITNSMLIKGHGRIETHTTFFEYYKIQNVKLVQTIFQKRAKVMNIVLQTASGKIKIPCIPNEQAYYLYNVFLKKSQTSKKKWI